jgi:peptidoglycan hydrolase-like amidase
MKWVAETNDQDSIEKIKAMSLIIKSYTLFYTNSKNIHPSVPENSQYTAIDDPRIFQKYVWAWFEKTVKKWYQALNITKNEIILYEDFIPILPYFNCSAWFTYSAKDKFWRIDTPYLKEQIDFYKCNNFNWHWVWLSWKWAELMANKWINYKKIIQWFYNWVKIHNLY